MSSSVHVAIDLGAESGRAVVGVLHGGTLEVHEVHRFLNRPVKWGSGLFWDVTGLWANVQEGLGRAGVWCRERGVTLSSVGVDTWGVDFALLDERGELVSLPRCYRDPRNEAAYRQVLEEVGAEAIYDATGTQFMALNTLYQLAAAKAESPRTLGSARQLLFMPDLFHWLLCGEARNELTISSTSQMLDPRSGRWRTDLLKRLGVPSSILGEPTPPGTVLGTLRAEVAAAAGVPRDVAVVAPGSHDTASAVAAVPASGERPWAYLSSGTWSLMGVELARPVITPEARGVPFTNELGVAGTVRFLKNITGLWLVQELRREMEQRGEHADYAALARAAAAATPWRTLIDVSWAPFSGPGHMAEKIAAYARATDQPPPGSPGELVRCCLESLALDYSRVIEKLGEVSGVRPQVLHVIGGGCRNELLNDLASASTGLPLSVGPVEATAMGNILAQAMGMGEVSGLAAARGIVAASGEVKAIAAGPGGHAMQAAKSRYAALLSRTENIRWDGQQAEDR